MLQTFGSLFGRKGPHTNAAFVSTPNSTGSAGASERQARKQTFSKVFRWKVPAEQSTDTLFVEVVGSFTDWRPVPLKLDKTMNTWCASFSEILGNRTHHYVILVNGEPIYDHNCDGLAAPCGPQEERFQLTTNKGPRVCMLFAQTK